jgi:hypothetical protein
MAFKAIVDETEYATLPEPVKAEYVQKGDKYEIQVDGMKTQGDVDRLQSALTKEKGDHRVVREALTSFKTQLGDRKVEDVLQQLDRIPELEAAAAGKLDDTKINEIVENRIKSRIAPVERERDQLRTQVADKDKTIETYVGKDRTRSVHDRVREDAVKLKVLPEALDDALALADRHFEVTDEGRTVTKDGVGVMAGIEPEAWLTDLQTKRPHWWGQSTGGGASGNRGGGVDTTNNPFSAEHWNMTEQGKLVRENRAKADQLAKLAGTTVGGQKPQPKK